MNEQDYTTDQPRLKVKLIKGQKDSYGWEISATPEATQADISQVLKTVCETDQLLRVAFNEVAK